MSSSLLLQQCPACLVCLTWIVFVIFVGKLLSSIGMIMSFVFVSFFFLPHSLVVFDCGKLQES